MASIRPSAERRARVAILVGTVLTLPALTVLVDGQEADDLSANGQPFAEDDDEDRPDTLMLPFAFYNESFGAAIGYAHGKVGFPQPQANLLGGAMAGTEGSFMAFVSGRDILIPGSDRLFVDPILSFGYFSNVEAYTDGNPDFPGERAGSNDSDKDNFVEGDGWDNFVRIRLKYLFPIGHGEKEILPRYDLEDGLLVAGATGGESWWNPFAPVGIGSQPLQRRTHQWRML